MQDASLWQFGAVLASLLAMILAITFALEGRPDRLTGPATLGLALGTLLLAFISYRTLLELREGARAFIGPSVSLTSVRDPASHNVDYWRIALSLENSGNTPALSVHWIYTGGVDFQPDPEHTEVRITTPVTPDFEGDGVVLPKSKIPTQDYIVTRAKIGSIIQGQTLFYLGLVKYNDSFLQPHITKFCVHVYGGPWLSSMPQTALDIIIDHVEPAFNMCRMNNCADDQCPVEQRSNP